MRYHHWWYCVLLIVSLVYHKKSGNSFYIVTRLCWVFYMFTMKITCLLVWLDLPQMTLQCQVLAYRLPTFTWCRFLFHFIIIFKLIIYLSASLLFMENLPTCLTSSFLSWAKKWWDLLNNWFRQKLLGLLFLKWNIEIGEETKLAIYLGTVSKELNVL